MTAQRVTLPTCAYASGVTWVGLLPALCGCYLVHEPEAMQGGDPTREVASPPIDVECEPGASAASIVVVAGPEVWFVDAQGAARVVHRFAGRPDVEPSNATSSVASDGHHVVVTQATSPSDFRAQGNVELVILCSDGREVAAHTLEQVAYRNALRAKAFVRDGRVVIAYGSPESTHALVLLGATEHTWTEPFDVASAPDEAGTVLAAEQGSSAVAFHWVAIDGSDVPTRYLTAGAGTAKLFDGGLVWPAPDERRLYVETASSLRPIELRTLHATPYAYSGVEPVSGGWVMYSDSNGYLHRVHLPSGRVLPRVELILPEGLELISPSSAPAIDAHGRIFVVLRDGFGAALFTSGDGRTWTRASPWHTGTRDVHARQAGGSYVVWGSNPDIAGTGNWYGRPAEGPVREGHVYEVVRPDDAVYRELPSAWGSGQLPYSRYQLASDGRTISFWRDDRLFFLDVVTGEVIATDVTYSLTDRPTETFSPSKVSTFIPGPDIVIGD